MLKLLTFRLPPEKKKKQKNEREITKLLLKNRWFCGGVTDNVGGKFLKQTPFLDNERRK